MGSILPPCAAPCFPLLALVVVAGCGGSSGSTFTPAENLAAHDDSSDSSVYSTALDDLNGYCHEDQPKLAAEIDKTHDLEPAGRRAGQAACHSEGVEDIDPGQASSPPTAWASSPPCRNCGRTASEPPLSPVFGGDTRCEPPRDPAARVRGSPGGIYHRRAQPSLLWRQPGRPAPAHRQ